MRLTEDPKLIPPKNIRLCQPLAPFPSKIQWINGAAYDLLCVWVWVRVNSCDISCVIITLAPHDDPSQSAGGNCHSVSNNNHPESPKIMLVSRIKKEKWFIHTSALLPLPAMIAMTSGRDTRVFRDLQSSSFLDAHSSSRSSSSSVTEFLTRTRDNSRQQHGRHSTCIRCLCVNVQ